jgi:hypothetical protein
VYKKMDGTEWESETGWSTWQLATQEKWSNMLKKG